MWRQKLGKMANMDIGEPDLCNIFILQEIIGARRSLKSSTKYEHSHAKTSSSKREQA